MRFSPAFIDEVRLHADIVQVIQDYVSLKQVGPRHKGLCPFHAEKTPSFVVHRDKGFFHCFGCGLGGDVFKFLELQEKLSFYEAITSLAQRFGIPLPEPEKGSGTSGDADREPLIKMHELAGEFYQDQLRSPAGTQAMKWLVARGLTADTIAHLKLGYAPRSRNVLQTRLSKAGFAPALVLRSGLVVVRDNQEVVDRFRHRLMIPIARESGVIVAFGARALDADQTPKYLNSPETSIYSKSRIVYGLHLSRPAIRRVACAVLVEGYFDFAQLYQAGISNVVASCGTAMTPSQAHVLRRFAPKVVLSFDPDAAGQSAAERSCELLATEGLKVNVAVLPSGDDPDAFIRRLGGDAYREILRTSRPYLEYLLDRSANRFDLTMDEGRRDFLNEMLAVAARIPDAAVRDQFADRLAHRARITQDVIRAEIRKAAVNRQPALTARELPGFAQIRTAERGLLWSLVHQPHVAGSAIVDLDGDDMDGLSTRRILQAAQELQVAAGSFIPNHLLERLSTEEAQLVTGIAAGPPPAALPDACVRALKRLRCERERASLQREIDRLQQVGASGEIDALWERKKALVQQIEALST